MSAEDKKWQMLNPSGNKDVFEAYEHEDSDNESVYKSENYDNEDDLKDRILNNLSCHKI